MKRNNRKAAFWIWLFALWAVISCGGCGPKYEPISLEEGTQAAGKSGLSESKKEEEKKEAGLGEETDGENRTVQAQETEKSPMETESTEPLGNSESETSQPEGMLSVEETTEALSDEDMFYQQCGMTREEAEHGRTSFIEDVMNDSRDAVAARISYPRTVTVASGSYEVQDAVSFLAYYDEIFTDAFKAELDRQAEQELFCSDGMISFGDGLVWFFPSDSGNSMGISSIDNRNGCTVRYGGEQGVTGG
ncbi:MAG: hypothetical protein HFG65_15455 [Hungatella sp.]|nr:hypothetical protein [Hungatella sp.]